MKPSGIYQVTAGDKIQIECIGYGFPTPSVVLHYPLQVNSSMKETIQRVTRKGYLKLEFITSALLSGNYTCIAKNYLGERKAWTKVIGRYLADIDCV